MKTEEGYIRTLPSGRLLVKLGYVYFIYEDMATYEADAARVRENVRHLSDGNRRLFFNICQDGNWLAQTRRYSDIKQLVAEIDETWAMLKGYTN